MPGLSASTFAAARCKQLRCRATRALALMVARHRLLGLAAVLALGGCVLYPAPITETISGSVTDADTNAPIAAARIYLAEFPEHETFTAPDGHFALSATRKWKFVLVGSDMNPGRSVVVEAPQYTSQTRVVTLGTSKENSFQLHRAAK